MLWSQRASLYNLDRWIWQDRYKKGLELFLYPLMILSWRCFPHLLFEKCSQVLISEVYYEKNVIIKKFEVLFNVGRMNKWDCYKKNEDL